MERLGLRTTYSQADLERASQAPGKIDGMCSNFESLKGLDSGIGGECSLSLGEEPPVPPKLMTARVDTEVQDSGIGGEAESEDEPERDRAAVETPKLAPVVVEKQAPMPRRPRKTIVPGRATTMEYSIPSQPSSLTTSPSSGYQSNSTPAPTEGEVHRIHLQNQWQRILLQQQLHYLLPNKEGDTGLHLAVIHSRPDILTQLLALVAIDSRLHPALDEQNSLYQTALHIATHTQQVDMIQKLLAAGASLELTDHKGNTPLHIACKFSSTKCLDEIVRGVPLEILTDVAHTRNHQGQTCIHVATEHGNTDTLRKMKSIGIDMNIEDFHSGKTPLHLAVEKCSLTDVQFLTETCQVDVNRPTYSGCTPLHIAAGRGNIAVVAYLLSMGADPDLETDEGDTALDLAGSHQVATILTKAAALRWLNL